MTDSDKAIVYLGSDFEKYRQTLNLAIHSNEPYLEQINRYVLGGRGKEIRPVLSLLVGRCCGNLNAESFYCAAAAEMLHTATLMHDDVVDEACMRRGHLTVSSKYSPGAAVLTGDFWLSRALAILTANCKQENILNFAKAVQQMSEGELLQLQKAENLDTTEQEYYSIIFGKTAALFLASLKSSASAVGADAATIDAVSVYAENIGMAFQIRDDVLDYSLHLKTGKPAGADIKERKLTLPLLGAMQQNEQLAKHILSDIKRIGGVEKLQEDEIVKKVIEFVHAHNGIEYAQSKLESFISLAIRALESLPACREKEMLKNYAIYIGERSK